MGRKKRWNAMAIPLAILLIGGGIFSFRGSYLRGALLGLLSPVLRLQGYWGAGMESPADEKANLEKIFAAKETEYETELQSLHHILDLKEKTKAKTHAAQVLWYGKEFGKELLIIDAGDDAGIHIGDIAVDDNGLLVGTVREVSANVSKISAASNAGEAYEVDFSPLAARALARGIGARTFSVELIPADFPVRTGDILLLRGINGISVFLGEIIREDPNGGASLKQARAVLIADPSRAKEVLIVSIKRMTN